MVTNKRLEKFPTNVHVVCVCVCVIVLLKVYNDAVLYANVEPRLNSLQCHWQRRLKEKDSGSPLLLSASTLFEARLAQKLT